MKTEPVTLAPSFRFRIHFLDGSKVDVWAQNVPEAQKAAARRHKGNIIKVKRVREVDNG